MTTIGVLKGMGLRHEWLSEHDHNDHPIHFYIN